MFNDSKKLKTQMQFDALIENYAERIVKLFFIADISNCGDFEKPEIYQVYLNGNWIADCMSYEEAETIANQEAMNGRIDIERV